MKNNQGVHKLDHSSSNTNNSASLNEADSNQDLSDEDLDISQRMCDNLSSENSPTDENVIIDANVKLQSIIDGILST
jgi:hypothetical protein